MIFLITAYRRYSLDKLGKYLSLFPERSRGATIGLAKIFNPSTGSGNKNLYFSQVKIFVNFYFFDKFAHMAD